MPSELKHFLNNLPGWLTIHEGQFLTKAARQVQKIKGVVVEIGSFQGKSTIYLALANNLVYAIDPHQGVFSGGKTKPTYAAFLHNLQAAGVSQKVKPFMTTSAKAAQNWKQPIKLLFIDGLHDETNARGDFELWFPFLVDAGVVAMHDSFCAWPGAGRVALAKIVNAPGFKEIGVVGSIIYGIKGQAGELGKLNLVRNRILINLALKLNDQNLLSAWLRFILIHGLIRLFLLNEFTLRRS